jgi:PAS domain S-box-containing protein
LRSAVQALSNLILAENVLSLPLFLRAMAVSAELLAAFISIEAAVAVALVLLVWERRDDRVTSLALVGDLLLVVGIQLGAIGLVLADTLALKTLFYRVGWTSQFLLPAAWLPFAMYYTGRGDLVTRERYVALVGVPFSAFVVLAWLAPGTLYFADFTLRSGALAVDYGPLFWVNVVYGYALVGIGVVAIGDQFLNAPAYREPVGLLLFGVLFPWFGNIVDVGNLAPGIPTTAMMILMTPVTWYIALYYYSALDVVPTARERLFERMDEGALVLDGDGRVIDANPTAAAVLGIDRDALESASPERLRERLPTLSTMLGETSDHEEFGVDIEGETRYVDIRSMPLEGRSDREGETVGHLLLLRDVTERKRREQRLEERTEQLRRQNDRLDQFASVVSHDLRNPLGVAQGYLEMAEDGVKQDRAFEGIAESHERMEDIIDDVLAMARSGEAVENPETLDLGTVATAAWEGVETDGATLCVDDLPDVTLAADRPRLQRAFENLFRNAVEHGAPDGETLTLRVGTLDDADGFYVADDGVGIPAGERESVFGRDYTTGGTGLGLSIVRDIVEAHGWAVSAEESEDGGARFEFRGVDSLD